VLETIRVRGYGVDRLGEDTVRMLRALVAEAPETTESIAGSIATNFAESAVLDVLDGELVAGELYRVVTIAAPVFDVDATVRATVTVAHQTSTAALSQTGRCAGAARGRKCAPRGRTGAAPPDRRD